MFFLFRKKERTKEKSIAFGLFSRGFIMTWAFFLGIIYWEGTFAFLSCLSRTEPAALTDAFVRGSRKL